MSLEATPKEASWRRSAVLFLCAVSVGIGLRLLPRSELPSEVVRERLIMGTTCRLIAVGPRGQAERALDLAWREIESVNADMSTYDPHSELSQFNAAGPDLEVPISRGLMEVLRRSQTAAAETRGSFDVTVLPLIRLWKASVRKGREPTPAELNAVLDSIGPDKFTVRDESACKHIAGLEITLDGIAPGYAVQQAVVALQTAGLSGGLIDLGGDIACFGKPLNTDAWQVAVQDPWSNGHLGVLSLSPARGAVSAVSTSGDYRRYLEIGDRRYSHILDPRTGRPATQASSVTVIAPDAVAADVWATALSVLGPQDGLKLCEDRRSLEALFISGSGSAPVFVRTPGFPRLHAELSKTP